MKILLVEDDQSLVAALKIGLEKEGYTVDTLNDGELGRRRLEIHGSAYDLAILDLGLPSLTGDEICRQVRARGITIPILILTGKSDTQNKVDVLNLGADDYLTKPFSVDELNARIRALLRRPKIALPTTLTVADITLDVSKRTVFKKDKEVSLTLKEFGVLEYFMHHPNQIVFRDDILDHVWDFNFSSFSNIVDVHINKLRSKLGLKRGGILETVRGVGYRLKA